eukprot:TRINITY_DN12326_c0_g1_i1.p2 TRINITY_DN12326_c0_g1~~TRINITY_DN12326_c0_g1_i1.p2  ORF type:complete len:243 (+),score=64.63 TRINITY_DN12326_c0_g1_i1:83-811(+)
MGLGMDGSSWLVDPRAMNCEAAATQVQPRRLRQAMADRRSLWASAGCDGTLEEFLASAEALMAAASKRDGEKSQHMTEDGCSSWRAAGAASEEICGQMDSTEANGCRDFHGGLSTGSRSRSRSRANGSEEPGSRDKTERKETERRCTALPVGDEESRAKRQGEGAWSSSSSSSDDGDSTESSRAASAWLLCDASPTVDWTTTSAADSCSNASNDERADPHLPDVILSRDDRSEGWEVVDLTP